jgi:hypothetical protein
LRKTKNELEQVVLDPKTNFSSSVNVGNLTASGVEFQLNKGDFSRNGLAGQLSYTYTYATVKFSNLPTGGTVLDGVNQSIQTYNAYTSYCSTHSTDKRCGSTSTGAAAGPCFAPSASGSQNVSSPCSSPGAFANPYWNAPVQGLYDPGASYIAYNQLPGTGLSSVASSYNVPHVATLLLNYRHDRLAITPALQIAAGGRYGSPVEGNGIDPLAVNPANGAKCAPLSGVSGLNGDPRYPYGGTGLPYDAQTCGGLITTPNFQTGHFDNFGAFREPTSLNGSLQMSYDASNRVTLRLTAANVFTSCFGGTKEPWTNVPNQNVVGCWYSSPGGYVGNVYNPGNSIQQFVKNSYAPTLGNVFQQAFGGQTNPLQLFLSAQIKL